MDRNEQQHAVVAALDSQVEEIRHQAVRRLSKVFEKVPPEHLLKALGDSSWRVRKAGVHLALDPPVTPELLDALVSGLNARDNVGLRNSATEVLIRIGRPVVEVVCGLLQTGDRDTRKFAADILGEIGLDEAVDSLLVGLDDEEENVRGASAEALGLIGDKRCVERLLQALQQDSLLVQLSCLDALGRLDAQVPMELLRPLLQVRPLKPQVFRLLGGLRESAVVDRLLPILIEGLESRGRSERAASARALLDQYRRADRRDREEISASVARVTTDELCERMRGLLESPEAREREAAVAVLGWTGRTDVTADLIRVADDERLREQVMESILAIGSGSADVLGELLDELGRAEKVIAVELLGHFGQPDNLPRIVQMCLDEDPEVSEAAQRTLGHLGDASVLPTLVGLLQRGGGGGAGAVRSLIMLGERYHDEVVLCVEPLISTEHAGTRAAAAEVLCGVAGDEDRERIERLAGDQDSRVRAAAIRALDRFGGADVTDRLRMMLADENPEVRAAAARVLGNRPGEEARAALRVALSDRDPWVVAEALAGLGQGGSTDAFESILPFAEHPDGAVALQAVRALNELGWGDDQQRFLQASRHADPEVVKEVLAGCDGMPLESTSAALIEALDNEHWDVRMAAVKKIGALRWRHIGTRMLAERLSGELDPLVRRAMEQILRLDGEEGQ